MFGLNDNSDKNNQVAAADAAATSSAPGLDNSPPAPITMSGPAPAPAPIPAASSAPEVPVVAPPPPPTYNSDPAPAPVMPVMPAPAAGMSDVSLNNAYIPTDPVNTNAPSANSTADANQQPTAASLLDNAHEEELIKLKQKALENLAPLIDHLDQTAEEKFKTTMMLIQASDNAELIQEAFEAASKITDEKIRAQALLDVVNEINYFTHHSVAPSEQAV